MALTNSDGSINDVNSYDSFGNPSNSGFSTRYQFTGREFDSFSGLQYSRARFYDPQIGRFISEDPIGFRGGDVNLYGYVGNDPINFKDSTGLFPSKGMWKYHQDLMHDALNGLASPSDIDALAAEQGPFDANTQEAEYGPMHAMARPGQDPQSARDEANRYYRRQICLARRLEKMGFHGDAMANLGRAAHTIQDSSSPAHFDFQPAWPEAGFTGYFKHWYHYFSEAAFVEPGAADIARENTLKTWKYFKGDPIPSDVFPDLYDTKWGPSYSPSQTHPSSGGFCTCE